MSDPRHDKVIDEATDASSPGGESVSGYGSGVPRTHRRNIVRVALAAVLAGRCLSSAEHRQSFCMLPADHAPLAHDDCMGCTWTDADHWQPSAIDRLAGQVEDVRALHASSRDEESQGYLPGGGYGYISPYCVGCEAFDEYAVAWPCATIRAIDGTEADRRPARPTEGDNRE